jgi:hypothetical protein
MQPGARSRHGDPLDQWEETEEESALEDLVTGPLKRESRHIGEEGMSEFRTPLLPMKEGEGPQEERPVDVSGDEEGGAVEEALGLGGKPLEPADGGEDAVGGQQLASRLLNVAGGFDLVDGEPGKGLGKIRLARQGGEGGVADVGEEFGTPEGSAMGKGLGPCSRRETEELRDQVRRWRPGVGLKTRERAGEPFEDPIEVRIGVGGPRPVPGADEETFEEERVCRGLDTFGRRLSF